MNADGMVHCVVNKEIKFWDNANLFSNALTKQFADHGLVFFDDFQ